MRLASFSLWLGCLASSTVAFSSFSTPKTFGKVAVSGNNQNLLRHFDSSLAVASADTISVANMERGVGGRIEAAFEAAKQKGEAAFVTFITAGYPNAKDTPALLMAMQEGGASVIELGIPYTDPQADGATIQHTNQVAIAGGTSEINTCLDMVKKARDMGLTVPVSNGIL
jgi:hypothetical protein